MNCNKQEQTSSRQSPSWRRPLDIPSSAFLCPTTSSHCLRAIYQQTVNLNGAVDRLDRWASLPRSRGCHQHAIHVMHITSSQSVMYITVKSSSLTWEQFACILVAGSGAADRLLCFKRERGSMAGLCGHQDVAHQC